MTWRLSFLKPPNLLIGQGEPKILEEVDLFLIWDKNNKEYSFCRIY